VLGAVVSWTWFRGARWFNEPLHSTIECLGGVIALLVVALVVLRRRALLDEPQYAMFAVSLTWMGILDLAHACVPQGAAFFWSRTLPTLAGGAAMSLVWMRPRARADRLVTLGVGVSAALASLVAAALIAAPRAWPLMFSEAGYTSSAKLLNVAGGLGSLAGALFFLRRYRETGSREHLVVADQSLLFGAAGVLFMMSHMWGAVWWLFHFLRLAAYLVLLTYAFALYKRFQREQGALEARMEFQQLMLGTVTHDMRSPLTAMKMSLALLRRRGRSTADGNAEVLDRVERNASRLEELVGRILDFTRARSEEGIPVSPERTTLEAVVARAVDELAASYPERRIASSTLGDTSGWWDPARLAQVVTNLLQNALRYGAAGGEVHLAVDGSNPAEVLLRVHNAGDPIPASVLPRLFEPFQRGPSRADQVGVGLGLFIVREIVRGHGGRISVASTAEAGTTFEVALPRERSR
jgi:signal transduction histidine kinase